jgi:phosphotransferase system enzyme I (PtsP)
VLSRIEPGDAIVVDGDNAQVLVRPADDILQTIHAAIEARDERRRKYTALRDLPSATRDQARISLHMNAGLLIDMQHLDETGADGVGLYRTEIPFMVRSEFPDVDAQTWLYSRVLDVADGRPVTFRTLDVGGDKVLPYVGAFGDDNPAMGWRAIRIGLDRPAMLRRQLRALIQGANGRPLSVMFPMIAEVSELLSARGLLDLELERAKRRGQAVPERLRVGVMFEVPALAWQLDSLLPMSTSFRWGRTTFCSSFTLPTGATPGWPAATTACPHPPQTATFCGGKGPAGRGRTVGLRRDGGPSGRGAGVARHRRTDALDVTRRDRSG